MTGLRGFVVFEDNDRKIDVQYSDLDMRAKTEENISELFDAERQPIQEDKEKQCELHKVPTTKQLVKWVHTGEQTKIVYD
jgi:hypothetical protein